MGFAIGHLTVVFFTITRSFLHRKACRGSQAWSIVFGHKPNLIKGTVKSLSTILGSDRSSARDLRSRLTGVRAFDGRFVSIFPNKAHPLHYFLYCQILSIVLFSDIFIFKKSLWGYAIYTVHIKISR